MIVTDASPLIVMAKLQRLQLLNDLHGDVLIGPVVKRETVDAGRIVSAWGVEQIEAALERGWLRVASLTDEESGMMRRLTRSTGLDPGEAESIALAGVRHLRLIVDDKQARSVAAAAGIEHVGTAGTLLEAYLHSRMGMDELEAALADLSRVLWLSPAVVAEILRLARETTR